MSDEELKKDWDEAGVEVRDYSIEEVGKVIKELKGDKKEDLKKAEIKLWTSASASWALGKVCEEVSSTPTLNGERLR